MLFALQDADLEVIAGGWLLADLSLAGLSEIVNGGSYKLQATSDKRQVKNSPKKGSLLGLHIQYQAVPRDVVAVLCGDLFLELFNSIVVEFDNLTSFDTHHMIMVIAAIEFKDGMAAIEIVSFDQTSRFKLRENPVDSGQTHVFPSFQKRLVDIFSTEVALNRVFQNLQDLHPWQGHFKADFP